MNEKILIVGFGNTLRRDDGVGIAVVQQLQARNTNPKCTFLTAVQLCPEMMSQFILADRLFIIDANAEIQPGTIQQIRLKPEQTANHQYICITLYHATGLVGIVCGTVWLCPVHEIVFHRWV